MFVIDDTGNAKKVKDVGDILDIKKSKLKVIDDDGKVLVKKASKEVVISKMFGEEKSMKFLKRYYTENKKAKEIDKKIKTAKETKAVKAEKQKFSGYGLSEDEAEFMARRNVKKAKQKETVGKVMDALGGAVNVLDSDIQAMSNKKTSHKGKKNKKSGKSNKKKGNPLEMDIPGFEF